MKIIVQAGGLGSRMYSLTKNKPKALIPVKNRPIIFHLFERMNKNGNSFVVIGDYKFDVLDQYLSTFWKSDKLVLIRSSGFGNASGIQKALDFVEDGEPVLLVWCDLILPKNILELIDRYKQESTVLVGSVDFACSWMISNGRLLKQKTTKNGVAGLFFFPHKEMLKKVPCEGSFTTWLSMQDFTLAPLPLRGCVDVGTKEVYDKMEGHEIRCRPYNQILIEADKVIKRGLTKEAATFLQREINWYQQAEEFGIRHVPKLLDTNPLTLSRIEGVNVFAANLSKEEKREVIIKFVDALTEMHRYGRKSSNPWDLYHEFFSKTVNRVKAVASSIPLANETLIKINGIKCKNILYHSDLFRECIIKNLMNTHYAFYHGDCQLTNTLINAERDIYFIDPRGYFGLTQVVGDVRYDWVKLYYGIVGNFDQFNVKNFDLSFKKNAVEFAIGSGGWEFLSPFLFKSIPKVEGSEKEIKLIHSIVWLSMASHVWEDFDSMCVAFYNGTFLFEKWLRRYYE